MTCHRDWFVAPLNPGLRFQGNRRGRGGIWRKIKRERKRKRGRVTFPWQMGDARHPPDPSFCMIDRYTRPEMAAFWTDQRKYEIWLEIEVLACEAMAEIGVVPKGDAQMIRAKAKFDLAE